MSGISVLYIGSDTGTCLHRCDAMRRLGYDVTHLDPSSLFVRNPFIASWNHHTGSLGFASFARRRLLDRIGSERFDLVWVDGGALVSPELVSELRERFGMVINYNLDDPFGTRDGLRFRQYLKSVPYYDLLVLVRDCNIQEAEQAGAQNILKVFRSADEVRHAPRDLSSADFDKWKSEVTFIGTWMPERGPFLARLIELQVPLTIRGNRWRRAPEWNVLRPYWKGPGLNDDEEYAGAVQGSRVCLGLLSKENRDLSTQRSFEIPHLGGVLCAERTPEHLDLYREDVEAVFWSSPEECASQCERLLSDEEWRKSIARNGRARCLQNKTLNENVIEQIIGRVRGIRELRGTEVISVR